MADNEYGAEQADGRWDGMIGEVLSTKADIAVGPLTINYEREKKVSFTKPFMNMGVSILFKKPTPTDPGPFSFLQPLGPAVWLSILVAFVMVSVGIFVVGRVSPSEGIPVSHFRFSSVLFLKFKIYIQPQMFSAFHSVMQFGLHVGHYYNRELKSHHEQPRVVL